MGCLSCDFESDLCKIFENAVFLNEETTPIFSKGDYNWAGVDFRVTLREYKG